MTAVDLSRLLGSQLTGVQYDILEWEVEPAADSTVDQVPKAVTLTFDGLRVQLRWDLRPPIERLVMVTGAQPLGPLTRRIDVSKRWEALLGSRLVGVSWAEQETPDGFQPWAVTLAFSGGGELVVALGELIEGTPTYIPDSLIVTSSREDAIAYRPPASPTPAWTRADKPGV